MKTLVFIIIAFISLPFQANAETFEYNEGNISFDISSLKYEESISRQDPLSLVFQAGKPPFTVSVFFKREADNQTLNDFIIKRQLDQGNAGYFSEIKTSRKTNQQYSSAEFIRNSRFGNMHWFIFQKASSNQIYAFWLVESTSLESENKQALAAYETMKTTLK